MCAIITLPAQQFTPNYDESKVPEYKLPDLLVFNNGSKVTDMSDWDKRRQEILKVFETEVYGISPAWKGKLLSQEISSDNNALEGKAIRKEIKITLQNQNRSHEMILLLYLPKSSGPVPVFLGLNFGGNHTVTPEPGISITSTWVRNDEKEDKLPVDQHELLALIAPRPVYVASAEEDQWADPRGEFLSCFFASQVYQLLGKPGIKNSEMPAVNQPVVSSVGYHIRSGGHNVTLYDWQQYIKFAELHLK
ncbi:MAG: hypothetical protein A2X03_03625 [Bacteroidetes bacterium GWA2_40_15]|nr:MAG: hypothetical protein A2X03_03625 [Bacteroidetes bacterium GWA2_40_15]